jgi:hypothetical protein
VTDVLAPSAAGVPAVPTRVYRPQAGPGPLVVYAHGGGWTIGSLDTHDRMCRLLADTSGAAVLSVDYRLAPEHPAPAAIDDVVHVLRWVASAPPELGPAPSAVAVAGDSAGGALAALACRACATLTPRPCPTFRSWSMPTRRDAEVPPSCRLGPAWDLGKIMVAHIPHPVRIALAFATRHLLRSPRNARSVQVSCPNGRSQP